MPKICYVAREFRAASLRLIDHANTIIAEYQAQNFVLTVRQLYYQFVARDLIKNTVRNYQNLASLINDARLAGLIDWQAIEDRTRGLASLGHWRDPAHIIDQISAAYQIDKWATQPYRIEVWIEKEALAGVFEGVCQSMDVPFLSCRGYTSQSEMWRAAIRLKNYRKPKGLGFDRKNGQHIIILHFGDHDPSGIDMSRDIQDRLALFGLTLEFRRLALNMDQIDEFQPPPNPAKETDSRFAGYLATHGDQSWELDALEPQVLADLVRREILSLRNEEEWKVAEAEESAGRWLLEAASENWPEVSDYIRSNFEQGKGNRDA